MTRERFIEERLAALESSAQPLTEERVRELAREVLRVWYMGHDATHEHANKRIGKLEENLAADDKCWHEHEERIHRLEEAKVVDMTTAHVKDLAERLDRLETQCSQTAREMVDDSYGVTRRANTLLEERMLDITGGLHNALDRVDKRLDRLEEAKDQITINQLLDERIHRLEEAKAKTPTNIHGASGGVSIAPEDGSQVGGETPPVARGASRVRETYPPSQAASLDRMHPPAPPAPDLARAFVDKIHRIADENTPAPERPPVAQRFEQLDMDERPWSERIASAPEPPPPGVAGMYSPGVRPEPQKDVSAEERWKRSCIMPSIPPMPDGGLPYAHVTDQFMFHGAFLREIRDAERAARRAGIEAALNAEVDLECHGRTSDYAQGASAAFVAKCGAIRALISEETQ